MNCKPGDLAVIVRPHASYRNLGKLVTVVSRVGIDDMWRVKALRPMPRVDGE